MASSPYRYNEIARGQQGRTRTGLAGVGTGNGGAAPYQLAALQPGMRGFWASGFGAPATGETPDRALPTASTTATPTQTAPDTTPAAAGGPGRTDAGEGPDATMMGPEPANHDLFGDLGINGKTVGGILGGAVGSLAGPLGGIAGALGGRMLGSMFDGGGAEAPGMGGDPANAQSNASENSAANSGASPGGNMMGDGTYAEGGRVTHLYKGNPMHGKKPAGLAGVGGGYMGGYAMGGQVPNYADGGMVDGAGLAGPDPAGPDDGYAALDGGEYVVRAQQAQRPEYAPILEQMNQGTYQPSSEMSDPAGDAIYTSGATTMDATVTSHAQALDPMDRSILLQAMQASPDLQAAMMALLGPDGLAMLQAPTTGAEGVDTRSMMFARAPLAGPPPIPGTASPPGFPPPGARRGGLSAVATG